MVKKASLRCRTVTWEWKRERERSTGVWNYWVYGDNSCIDESQVLDQVTGAVYLAF